MDIEQNNNYDSKVLNIIIIDHILSLSADNILHLFVFNSMFSIVKLILDTRKSLSNK